MQKTNPHKIQPGRSTAHNIMMALNKGWELLESGGGDNGDDEGINDKIERRPEVDDIIGKIFPDIL